MAGLNRLKVIQFMTAGLAIGMTLACGLTQAAVRTPTPTAPPTQAVYLPQAAAPLVIAGATEVTRIVPGPTVEVTRLVPGPTVEVTRLVPGPEIEVTRLVEVVVVQTVPVEVTRLAPGPTVEVTRLVLLSATNTPVNPNVNQSLLVWYDFEGNFLSSGRVSDRSGNGYHASLNGTVDAANGLSGGQALGLSGSGYIQTRGNPAAGLSAATFSLWLKTDRADQDQKLASAAWWSGGPGSGWVIGTHFPELWGEDTDSLFRAGQQDFNLELPTGRWVYYVVVYDGGRIREYLDGKLVVDLAARSAAIGSGRDMAIGGWPQYAGFNYVGSIDEFRIYPRALTGAEILTLFNQR